MKVKFRVSKKDRVTVTLDFMPVNFSHAAFLQVFGSPITSTIEAIGDAFTIKVRIWLTRRAHFDIEGSHRGGLYYA